MNSMSMSPFAKVSSISLLPLYSWLNYNCIPNAAPDSGIVCRSAGEKLVVPKNVQMPTPVAWRGFSMLEMPGGVT